MAALPQISASTEVQFYTVTDPGKTTFKEGEIISRETFEKENERVRKLGEKPAQGVPHIAGELRGRENGHGWPTEDFTPQTIEGTCYQDAWRFLIREEEGELVHGSVQTIGKRIDHAWVELPTGFIWEPESGEFMKKKYFYERAEPQVHARYSGEQAAIMAARTKHFGPWTEEEVGKFLHSDKRGLLPALKPFDAYKYAQYVLVNNLFSEEEIPLYSGTTGLNPHGVPDETWREVLGDMQAKFVKFGDLYIVTTADVAEPPDMRTRATWKVQTTEQPKVVPPEPARRAPKENDLELLPDSPEYLAYTVQNTGLREKLDEEFQAAIKRARSG